MSKRLFTSDWHLGHNVITKYRTQFSSIAEHDQHIFDKLALLSKRDIVFVLGDIVFDSPKYDFYIETLNKMSCRFKFVLGNHDSLKLYKETRLSNMELCLPIFSYKNNWISHAPIHSTQIFDRECNIHGHLHYSNLEGKYYNVNLDQNNYDFVDFEQIQEKFSKKGEVYDTTTVETIQ